MKLTTKIAAVCLMAVASVSYAQVAKKEVVLDTGKGGIELTVSVPSVVQGPMDFSGNDGVFKYDYTNKGVNYSVRKAMFGTHMGSTGTLQYFVTLSKVSSKNRNDEGFTPRNTAAYLLDTEGFKIKDAKKIDNLITPFNDGITETYEICGQPVTDHPRSERECAVVVASVTKDYLQSIGMMASIVEKNVEAFNSNKDTYIQKVENALKYMGESNARIKP